MNVLIVDDQPINQKLLRAQLEAEGITVCEARDGVEALATLKCEPVEAVISDILMPRMDGYHLCDEIRRSPQWHALPLIFYTSTYTSQSDEEFALMAGANKFLRKPAPTPVILEALREVTRAKAMHSLRPRALLQEPVVLKEYNERLIAKLEHKNNELILQSAAVETAGNAILITDYQGNILYSNPAFTALSGYTADEVAGQNPRMLKSGQHNAEIYSELWQTILSGQTWHGELTNRRKDGTLYDSEQTITPVLVDGRTITHYIGIMSDVTARKRAEVAQRVTHAQMQHLLAHSPAVLYAMKLEGDKMTPSLVSEYITRLLGFTVSEAKNYDWWLGQLHPEDREHAVASIPQTIARDTSCTEYRMRHKDGSYHWLEDNRRLVRDTAGVPAELVGTLTDITLRKQSESALRASEQRFKAIFKQAAVGVAQLEVATGRFEHVNSRFCEMLGRNQSELELLPLAAVMHPLDGDHVLNLVEQVKAGAIREFTQEKRYVRKDGSVLWAITTVSAMWAPDEAPDHIIAVVQDVTQRKALEEQYRQAQKMEAIGTLAGGIAHDFNNILGAINGYTQLAKLELSGSPAVEHLDAVLHGAARATDLVRQILTFSRREEQQLKVAQLRSVVTEALKFLRASIPATIVFETSFATEVPNVLVDVSQVHQVIMNLCTNAAHAMRQGTGRLKVKLMNVQIDAEQAEADPRLRPGAYVLLAISDSGHGMDAATITRIFEPFFSTKEPGEGTGLGLAVVHGIMQSHGGAITVHSHPGEGTTFHLYFPAHSGQIAVIAAGPAATPRGQGQRILYVDDELPLARLGQIFLVRLGYAVDAHTNPVEAIAAVRARPAAFDLVVTDQMMPGMMGTELAQQLHAIRPDLPIILVTGYNATMTHEQIKQMGIKKLLLKPVSFETLGTLVHQVLNETPTR